jgi:hypothetical protein
MSDLAYSIRSAIQELLQECDYRILCEDEREELLLAERLIAQCLQIDDDVKRDVKDRRAA